MDGVIADTARYHEIAWRHAFEKRGFTFTRRMFRRSFGHRNDTVIPMVLGAAATPELVAEIGDEKEAEYRRLVAADLTPLAGALELLAACRAAGFRQGLASSAPRANVDQVLSTLAIAGYFQAVVSEKDVAEGKPSPQAFLLVARRLGVEPARCIVIEDAVSGVEGARRAGMRCVAVTNTHPRESLAAADRVVASLTEVTAADLAHLIGVRAPANRE